MSSNERDPDEHVPSENWEAFRHSLPDLEEQRNQHVCDESEDDPEEEEIDYPSPDQDNDEHRQEDPEEEDREEELQRQNRPRSQSDACNRESASKEIKVNQHSHQDDSSHDGKREAQHQ